MALRKEQVLLLVTAVLLGLLAWMSKSESEAERAARARVESYERLTVPPRVMGDVTSIAAAEVRDPFLKPTRTVPLPPLDLPELAAPPLPRLPIVAPPLRLGPGVAQWHELRIDPDAYPVVLKPDTTAPATSDVGNEGGDPNAAVASDPSAWQLAYDKLETTDGREYWGQILGGDARFERGSSSDDDPLAIRVPFRNSITMRRIDPETGKVIVGEQVFEPTQVQRVLFANTIQNRIALARRRIPPGDAGLRDRERLVARLLGTEGQYAEALDEAESQARAITKIAPAERRGWELMLEVYARTGQFEKQMALFEEMANGPFTSAPFVARERGVLHAHLGLLEDAENYLREAVRKDGNDPRNSLALSRYLSERGRDVEALEMARLARRSLAPSHGEALRFSTLFQLARAALATGQHELASRTTDEASAVASAENLLLLRGAVELAKGNADAARASFVAASASLPDSVMALVGAGVCSFRAKDWDGAYAAFQRAADRDPLERHLALAAQGFMLMLVRDGSGVADAVSRLEQARRMAPLDPYVLYLLGRGYRLAKRYSEAREVLDACLRERFDFVEAAIELARTELEEARLSPAEGFALLENAERLAARACLEEASRAKQHLYPEMLGIVRYHLRKNDRARTAFELSQDWKGDVHAKLWLALLRNRLGHTEEAIAMLRDTSQFIKDPTDPLKVWAESTRKWLSYHRGKRLVKDDFEAQAKHWTVKRNGQNKIRWIFGDGALAVRGEANRELPCYTRYVLDRAGEFVRVALDANFGKTTGARIFLRVSDEREGGRKGPSSTIDARVGFDGRRPFAYLRRGSQENDKTTVKVDAEEKPLLFAVPASGIVRVEIEYEVLVDDDTSDGSLVIRWGGQEVARKKMRFASGNRELYIDVRCEPRLASSVDATFRRFRLVRLGQ